MEKELKQRAQGIFMDLAELAPSERDDALAVACKNDAGLRAEVLALLAAHDQVGGFMASTAEVSPESSQATDLLAGAGLREGEMIGRYKLLQPLGEGGFGVVWMAEQREPVKRRVALKIIKLGMDTKQVIARFEAERQALAMMDHPNIAKVLDAGATDTGRPYFVMEYIRGVPVLEYCDQEKLSTRARLELFGKVCSAIQHAHHKGVIHRDIKPSNVLVTMHDGVPEPKVIDFGIAKATGFELTQKTLFTEHRQMIGTPAYMSPEQTEMSGLDVDTRSDIYSLGVLLYELLTGATPFDSRELLSKGYAEMMRVIREVEPDKPSSRLSTLGKTATKVAQVRLARDPGALGSIIRGDLDWIVMKCLEKDRRRRYESASALAADVKRHLEDQPVSAGPPSTTYRVQKFIRRNRARVLAAAVLLFALLLGLLGTSIGMLMARQAANAERAARTQADEARRQAEANLAYAKSGNQILGSVFESLNANSDFSSVGDLKEALGNNLKAAAMKLDSLTQGDPLDVASMQQTLGRSLTSLGRGPEATEVLSHALASCREHLGPDDPRTLDAAHLLARAHLESGDVRGAIPIEEVTFHRRVSVLGADDSATQQSRLLLGYLYARDRRTDEAVPLIEEAVSIATKQHGDESAEADSARGYLAAALGLSGHPEKVLPLREQIYQHSLKGRKPDDPTLLIDMMNLAAAYSVANRPKEAVPLYQTVLARQRERLGRDHPQTLLTLGNLAVALSDSGEDDEALKLYNEVYSRRLVVLGPDHPQTIGALYHLADATWRAGSLDAALPMLQSLVTLNRDKFGPDHPDTINSITRLAQGLEAAGRRADALPLYAEALKLRQAKLGSDSPQSLSTLIQYAAALHRAGDDQSTRESCEDCVFHNRVSCMRKLDVD